MMPTPCSSMSSSACRLTSRRFSLPRDQMVADLKAGRPFHPRLRIQSVQGYPGVFEMTWEMHNGRATFNYGPPQHAGDMHIHWRRIGDHSIFKQP